MIQGGGANRIGQMGAKPEGQTEQEKQTGGMDRIGQMGLKLEERTRQDKTDKT